jgi:hypothetical protein
MHFGGKITGAFLPEPVAFSGSASTDLEVKERLDEIFFAFGRHRTASRIKSTQEL